MKIRERYQIADYIEVPAASGSEKEFALMGVGFTAIDENPSAQIASHQFVCDKAVSKSIRSYDPSFAFELLQVLEESAVKYIVNIGERQLTGTDAETRFVKVDLTAKVSNSDTEYEARLFKVAVEVSSLPNNEGQMGGSGNLLPIGDPVIGKFNITTRTFTEEGEATE
ncbi:MAG: hypothetical protein U0M23_06565 [Acutalibacteraceae bacterium]|nr:hypothetical protein [Acutalibacteraceae bacterium]